MELKIERSFDVKSLGNIGKVELVADVAKMTLDGVELPESSVAYLLTFALQSLQDAYAGAKEEQDAKDRFNSRLLKIKEGRMGTRERVAKAKDKEEQYFNEFAEAAMFQLISKKSGKAGVKAMTEKKAKERAEFVAKFVEAVPEAMRTEWREAAKAKVDAENSLTQELGDISFDF